MRFEITDLSTHSLKNMKLTKKEEKEKIAKLLAITKHWNEGLGLIVPQKISEALRKRGFTRGYSPTRKLPTK